MSRMLTATFTDRMGRTRHAWLDPALSEYSRRRNRWISFRSGMFWMGAESEIFILADVFNDIRPGFSVYEPKPGSSAALVRSYNAAMKVFRAAFAMRGPIEYIEHRVGYDSSYDTFHYAGFAERQHEDVEAQDRWEAAHGARPWRQKEEEPLCPKEFFVRGR